MYIVHLIRLYLINKCGCEWMASLILLLRKNYLQRKTDLDNYYPMCFINSEMQNKIIIFFCCFLLEASIVEAICLE